MKTDAAGAITERLRTLFPDREFIMRSQGQVRFITFSTRFQAVAAGIVTALLLAWLATIATMTVSQYLSRQDKLALIDREHKVASAESRVSAYRHDLDSVTADLARRQEFIESMVDAHIGELPEDLAEKATVSVGSDEASRTVDKVSAAIPEASGLVKVEARQLAFVERLTRYADEHAESAASAIRKLGLNPNAMLAMASARTSEGGPYFSLATNADGSLDPRFQRLGVSLARMDALQRTLAGIPQVQPANMDFVSSGFGYRADPFTGAAAFHSGLDFKGPIGAPIYAAAKGRVSFAGRKAGYGNCIEIDHGNGLVTRYAHMSRFRAKLGQKVVAGDVIGAIGSTGRSTGPHLHFEVRMNDRAVNPRPFLEASPYVHQETASGA